jgi:hypothetical protein
MVPAAITHHIREAILADRRARAAASDGPSSDPSAAGEPSVPSVTDDAGDAPAGPLERALETIEIHTTELGAYSLDPDTGVLLDIATGPQAAAELFARATIRQQALRPSTIAYDNDAGRAGRRVMRSTWTDLQLGRFILRNRGDMPVAKFADHCGASPADYERWIRSYELARDEAAEPGGE